MLSEMPATEKRMLVPIFSPAATKRDLGMAYYKAMLEGNQSLGPLAWKELSEQGDALRNDRPALDALGVMNVERGDGKAAEQIFRQVLAMDPNDLTALSNLGTLLARQNRLDEAVAYLHSAFARNQNIYGLAMNLARVECMAGHAAAAHSVLRATLDYNPDLESVERLMTTLSPCPQAGKQ